MTFDEVLTRLATSSPEQPSEVEDNWVLCCPAHDDHAPRLSVAEAAVGLTTADLFGESPAMSSDLVSRPRIVGQYTYTDEGGQPLFVARRYEPKGFRQFSPDGTGGWSPGLNGARQLPYRLPKVIRAAKNGLTIFVVEGGKDVHSVEGANWTATCNPGGAGRWRGEFNEHFRGTTRVIIVPDNDEPGIRHARVVAENLRALVERLSCVGLRTHARTSLIIGQPVTGSTSGS